MRIEADFLTGLSGNIVAMPNAPVMRLKITKDGKLVEVGGDGKDLMVEAMEKIPHSVRSKFVSWHGIDLHEVLKALELSNFDNKMMILLLLKRSDWIKILYMLDKPQLLWGMRFLSKAMLVRLILKLPKKLMIKMLLHLYPMEELIQKMPTNELMRILRSGKIQVKDLVKAFRQMDPKFLQIVMSKALGRRVDHLSQDKLLDMMGFMKKHQLMVAMEKLPFKALGQLVLFFTKQDPKLLERLSLTFFYKMFDMMSKPLLIESMEVLPKEILIEHFLTKLPDKVMVLVAAQIDHTELEKFLLSNHPNLLKMLGEMMTGAA